MEKKGIKIAAQNRKAFHDYFVEDRYEAGVELFGTEVKSIRAGTLNLKDSYCQAKDGEVFAYGVHISPYDKGNIFNKDPDRPKRLLLHKREIRKLHDLQKQQGYALIPLSVYFKDSRVKIELGLCKGKKTYDKREAVAKRDAKREMDRAMREKNRSRRRNMENNPIVTITMEDGGKIVAELYPDVAPQSVYNFISLIKKGFYNGLIFHRCIYGFMIQGGCPDGTGMGGPGYCIKGEFEANGIRNDLRHTRGVLSMARAQDMDSAGSQFFIMHKDSPHLDGQYAAFGMVIDGMDVVDEIASQPRNMLTNKPKKPQVMKSVTVDTQGVEYPEPEKLPDPFHS